jgi:hypothetical protein
MRHARVDPVLAMAILAMVLNGCSSWRTEEVAPASYIASEHPQRIRLTLLDSTTVELDGPVAQNDSIRGREPGRRADSLESRTVAQRDVRSFEVRRTSASKTAGLVLGIAGGLAAGFAVFVAIECSSLGCY